MAVSGSTTYPRLLPSPGREIPPDEDLQQPHWPPSDVIDHEVAEGFALKDSSHDAKEQQEDSALQNLEKNFYLNLLGDYQVFILSPEDLEHLQFIEEGIAKVPKKKLKTVRLLLKEKEEIKYQSALIDNIVKRVMKNQKELNKKIDLLLDARKKKNEYESAFSISKYISATVSGGAAGGAVVAGGSLMAVATAPVAVPTAALLLLGAGASFLTYRSFSKEEKEIGEIKETKNEECEEKSPDIEKKEIDWSKASTEFEEHFPAEKPAIALIQKCIAILNEGHIKKSEFQLVNKACRTVLKKARLELEEIEDKTKKPRWKAIGAIAFDGLAFIPRKILGQKEETKKRKRDSDESSESVESPKKKPKKD